MLKTGTSMEKIRLEIIGMKYSQSQSGAYALILEERNGKRRLPIIIGSFEAQAIAIELEKIKTPRPLTHDLFRTFAESFGIRLTEVVINKFQDGVFFAKLVCLQDENEQEIDSRTSDAIALALRFSCPIYTYDSILVAAGIIAEEEPEPEGGNTPTEELQRKREDLSEYSEEELKEFLQLAVGNEDYEKASQIRDEIKKRQTNR
jgi:bifunctional DNase/RNase